MARSQLGTNQFWREILERVGRQAAQTALPIVAAVGASGNPHGFNLKAAIIAVLVAVAVTVLKALAGILVQPGEGRLSELLDRAVPAAAGVLLGFVPVDVTNVDGVNWTAAFTAAAAAAATAVLAYYVTPPTTAAGRSELQPF